MIRILLIALVLGGAGCGRNGGGVGIAIDMTSGGAPACGEEGIMRSCLGAAAGSGCYACDFGSGGPGHCARPCLLASPDCPTGEQCVSFTGNGIFAFEGSCAGYGFCR